MNNNSKVYIVIVNNENWEDTSESIESILKSNYSNYQIIIVDNSISKNSKENIKAWIEGKARLKVNKNHSLFNLITPHAKKPLSSVYYSEGEAEKGGNLKIEKRLSINNSSPLILIENEKENSKYKNNNIVLKMILKRDDSEYLWFLNSGTIVQHDSLSELVAFSSEKDNGVTGSIVKSYTNPENTLFFGGGIININSGIVIPFIKIEDTEKPDFISGTSFFTEIENFKEFGHFSEEYSSFWGEVEWCTKVKNNLKFSICHNSVCYSKTGDFNEVSNFSEYNHTLDLLKFFSKYYPENVKSVLGFTYAKAFKSLFRFKFKSLSLVTSAINDFKKIK